MLLVRSGKGDPSRECPRLHLGRVALQRLRDELAALKVALGELRLDVTDERAEHVVHDEQLPVEPATRADAVDRDRKRVADHAGRLLGHGLQEQEGRPCILDRLRVGEQAFVFLEVLAVNLVAARRGDALRGETQVAHHRDSGIDDGLDATAHRNAALELHRFAATLGEEPAGVQHRGFVGKLVGHERHVADHHGGLHAARDRFRELQHLVHRHRDGVLVAEHRHAAAVTHQDPVHPGLVGEDCRRIIIGRDCRGGDSLALQLTQGSQVHLFSRSGHGCVLARRRKQPDDRPLSPNLHRQDKRNNRPNRPARA